MLQISATAWAAGPALALEDSTPEVQAWPAITMLSDPGKLMKLKQVLQMKSEFKPPQTAYGTLGLREQMLQGLLTGLALCLLIYGLANWATLREVLFLKYALLIFGSLFRCCNSAWAGSMSGPTTPGSGCTWAACRPLSL